MYRYICISPFFRPYVNFSISCTNKAFFGVINHAPAMPRLSTKCLSITDPSVAVHGAQLSKSPVAAEFRVRFSLNIVGRVAVRTHALPIIRADIEADIVIDLSVYHGRPCAASDVTFSPSRSKLLQHFGKNQIILVLNM